MKRIWMLLLAALLILGCQPTPEKEFIVNKGDNTIEEKLNATPKPVSEDEIGLSDPTEDGNGQQFPARWDAEPIEVRNGLTIAAHADVVTKADGRYPVYKSRAAGMPKERAAELAEKILGKPVGEGKYEMTKEDWKRALEQYLAEVDAWEEWVAAGKPDDGIDRDEAGHSPEEVERRTNDYMEHLRNAPDETTGKAVSDYSGLTKQEAKIYTYADGSKAYIFLFSNFVTISKTAGIPSLYTAAWHEQEVEWDEPHAKTWKPASVTREQAEAMLLKEMEKLDLGDYTVKWATEANLQESLTENDLPTYVSSGWSFTLVRNPGGYPLPKVVFRPSEDLNYGTGDDYVVNRPICEESITAYVSENGLEYFWFLAPKEITGIANPDVELLPFEEIRDRAIKSLSACFPFERYLVNKMTRVDLTIYTMLLTTFTVYAKDSSDYYEMPCWIVFFDGENASYYPHASEEELQKILERDRNNVDLTHEVLVLNAVDGSIIHEDSGY